MDQSLGLSKLGLRVTGVNTTAFTNYVLDLDTVDDTLDNTRHNGHFLEFAGLDENLNIFVFPNKIDLRHGQSPETNRVVLETVLTALRKIDVRLSYDSFADNYTIVHQLPAPPNFYKLQMRRFRYPTRLTYEPELDRCMYAAMRLPGVSLKLKISPRGFVYGSGIPSIDVLPFVQNAIDELSF